VILVFDLKTNAVLGKLPAMPDADGIVYNKAIDRVLAVSGDGGVLMIVAPDVDPHSGKSRHRSIWAARPNFWRRIMRERPMSISKTRTWLQSST